MKFKPKGILTAGLITLSIVVGIVIVGLSGLSVLEPTPNKVISQYVQHPQPLALDPSHIVAKAAILYDPTNKQVLFEKNSNEPLPLASLTKLATAETALAQEAPNVSITITSADLLPGGDWRLHVGDKLSLFQLLQMGFVASSNDAMAAVAASMGPNAVEEINATTENLGLTQMTFANPTGLDVSTTTAGAYGSAYDVALLATDFYKTYPRYFELTQKSSVSVNDNGRILTSPATDAPLLSIPSLIAAKTGYTDLAGGNLVAIFDLEIGHPLVAVVLGSTETGRFSDIQTLIAAAQQSL